MKIKHILLSVVMLFLIFGCEEQDITLTDDGLRDITNKDEPGQSSYKETDRNSYSKDGKYHVDITYSRPNNNNSVGSVNKSYAGDAPSYGYTGLGKNSGGGFGSGNGSGTSNASDGLGTDHVEMATGPQAKYVNVERIKFCTNIGSARITGITLRFGGVQDGTGSVKYFDHTYYITLSKYLNKEDGRYYIYSDKAREWIGEACDYAYEMLGSNQIRYESTASMQKGNRLKFRDYLRAGLLRRMPGSSVDMVGTSSNYSKCPNLPTRIN